MPDRYWIGGAGTWDTSSTTNWSALSGALIGGASVPTASDSVFFDQTGTYTVTMTGALLCLDITVSAGTVTFATGTTPTLAIKGNMTLLAGTVWSSTGAITFNATTTGKTITTNGVTISAPITLDGVGGGWTLGSALTMNTASSTLGLFTVTNGTFATGNFNMTLGAFASSNSNTRSVTLGTSTIAVSRWTFTTTTGLTFSGASSTINMTQLAFSGDDFNGGGLTYGTVVLTTINSANITLNVNGANTFGTLSVPARTAVGVSNIQFGANQTITTLTLSAPTLSARRTMLNSSTYGTQRTLTVTTITATVTDYDFRDLVISSATLSGTRIGNGGNCSGITFSTAKNVYWSKVAGGNWTDSDAWAATSGGVAASTNFPLMQDTAYIENTGLNTSTTVTIDSSVNLGSVDASGRTNAVALAQAAAYAVYGNFVMGSGVTFSGTAASVSFVGTAAQSINMNGVTFTRLLIVDKPVSGTVSLSYDFTSTNTVNLSSGTLNLQTYTLTATIFSSNNANARTLAFGTGNIVVNGTGTVWITAAAANLTVTGTPTVNVSNATATATTVTTGLPTEANSISFNFTTGTYALTFTAGSVRNLNFTGFAGTMANAAKTIYGNLTLAAAYTAGTNAWTFAATSGTKTITSNSFTIDWPLTFNGVGGTWQLQDALTMGSTRALTHTNGTLDMNGQPLTVGSSYTTASGTKNLTFNGGTLVCPAASATAFNNAVPTGFSTTAGTGTGTISMTAATAKTFVGGGSTFNCTLNQGGAGALTITGANTFTNIANTVQPASVLFTAATTNTFTNFNLNGSAGNLITIGSDTAASHTLSKASGAVSVDYVSISRSTATGGATWTAGSNSVDGGNNTGWVFSTVGYTITASNGTYAVTGQPVSISRSKLITASNGTYAVTGQNITVLLSRLLSAQNGVYSVTGQPVSIVASGAPTPVAAIEYFIEIRSFTERRRF